MMNYRATLSCLLILCAACGGPASDEAFSTTTTESGSLITRVNASDDDDWVYVDLDDTSEFIVDADTPIWDLAFRRQLIQVHNDELVAIAILDGKKFSSVDGAPTADKFFNDSSKDEDDLAFSQQRGWYSYNLFKHELSPRQPRTYIVRSTEGILYKLSFRGYYDDNDNGGYPSFEWARVDGKKIITGENTTPCSEEESAETLKGAMGIFDKRSTGTLSTTEDPDTGIISALLDASLGGPEAAAMSSYLYINLLNQEILELSDEEALTQQSWHIAVKRSELRANSADSGPGAVYVAKLEDAMLETLLSPPESASWKTDDFVDEFCNVKTFGLDFIETAFGQWYEYDFENHAIKIKDEQVYVVQDRDTNTSWGFAIDSFDSGKYMLRWKTLEP